MSPQSIAEEHISGDEYHIPKRKPAKRKKSTCNRPDTSTVSETTKSFDTSNENSGDLQSFQDSGIMTNEILLTSTPKKSKRPRLEW